MNRKLKYITAAVVASCFAVLGLIFLWPSHAATVLPFEEGTYITRSNGASLDTTMLPGYQSWLGHSVPLVEGFGSLQSYPASLSGDEQALDCPSYILDPITQVGKTAIISYDFMTYNQTTRKSDGETWATMANGSNVLPSGKTVDQRYKAFGQCLLDHGQPNAIIRMATEFNLNGLFPWTINLYDTTQVASFVSAERTFSNDIRSLPGQHFKLDWNFAIDPANSGQNIVTNAYPGDAYVDYVGIDCYDQVLPWGTNWTTPQDQWDRRYNGYNGGHGIKYYLDFARQHGKQVSFPEWALGWYYNNNGATQAPLEDPYYINQMFAVMNDPTNNVAYESYWEDQNGLFTADSSHKSPQSIAAFLADFGGAGTSNGTGGGTASTPTPHTPVSIPLHIHAGGSDYTDPSGTAWTSDAAFATDGGTDNQGAGKITGTPNPQLYENERWSNPHLGYAIPIANGTYTLKLHFAEVSPSVTAAGQRIFSGTAEGKNLFTNLDIFSEVGADKPDDKTYTVTVTDGELDLSFDATANAAKLSGLEVLKGGSSTPTPIPTPTPTHLVGDLDGNGHVDGHDVALLLINWNKHVTPNTGGDLDGNGLVSGHDVALLLTNWGK